MKTTALLLLFFIFGQPLLAEEIRFQVKNLRNQTGDVHLYVFDAAAKSGFPKKLSNAICHVQGKALSQGLEFSCDLKLGSQYAVFAHHDENENGTVDHNFFSFPLEGFGFSSGAEAGFGPPDFEDAAFIFSSPNEMLIIKMDYFFDSD